MSHDIAQLQSTMPYKWDLIETGW